MSSLSESLPMENSVNSNNSNKLVTRQYLEPTGKSKINEFLNLDKKNGTICPEIKHVGTSKLLDQVKSFLPEFKASELSLNARMEAGEDVDIEKIKDDMPHIEMNFQINEMGNSAISTLGSSESDSSSPASPTESKDVWTSDSDSDSAPSPAERDNSWTSDSDVDSSSSSSSSSCNADCPSTSQSSNKTDHESAHLMMVNGNSPHHDENNSKFCDNDTENRRNGQLKRKKELIEDITPSNSRIQIQNQLNTVKTSYKKHKQDDG